MKQPFQRIAHLARTVESMLPDAVRHHRGHVRQVKQIVRGEIVEKIDGVEQGPEHDEIQAVAWREAIVCAEKMVDELARLIVTHLPDVAPDCSMIRISTFAGPTFTSGRFDAETFMRQCRRVEAAAANKLLSGKSRVEPAAGNGRYPHPGTWTQTALTASEIGKALHVTQARPTFDVVSGRLGKQNLYKSGRQSIYVRLDRLPEQDRKRIEYAARDKESHVTCAHSRSLARTRAKTSRSRPV